MGFYILSIFLLTLLLFQNQSLIGKFILPWFGGTRQQIIPWVDIDQGIRFDQKPL